MFVMYNSGSGTDVAVEAADVVLIRSVHTLILTQNNYFRNDLLDVFTFFCHESILRGTILRSPDGIG